MGANLDADFEQFVYARAGSLLRIAILLVGDPDDAQDLLQQALWRAYRHWGRALEYPEAYVRACLVNLAHDRWRLARRRVREVLLSEHAHAVEADNVDAVLERDSIMTALRALPNRQRATIVLRFWEDLSVEETASTMGCSIGTVKSNTSKALARLRTVMDEQRSELETGGT